MAGWGIMINLIGVILVYLYLPPKDSGLPSLITQVVLFGFFNVIAVITAGGRLLDALFDPLIAQYSDRSKNPKGRRVPFMRAAILPSLVFCCLVFYPLYNSEHTGNIAWLAVMLAGFYIASTTYIIPYNALLPEIAGTSAEKVNLSTWQSAGYVVGIGVASNAFNIAALLQQDFGVSSKLVALQLTIIALAIVGAILMAVCAFGIDEKKYSASEPSTVKLREALTGTLRNKNFRLFIVADFTYFIGVTIITTGLIYFVTVLLGLADTIGNKLMITMVLVSFIFYPVVNILSAKIGKKPIVIFSFLVLAAVFGGISTLGKWDIDAEVQIYTLIVIAAVPLASLNILPNAILAEIIEEDSLSTGDNKEAMYFAVRYFFIKIAQTFGMALFAMLLVYGKDEGDDLGIRLNGALGLALCVIAALVFIRFKEKRISG
jgi:GPH family glycoside/pentoside/hexuronide:cation symporter